MTNRFNFINYGGYSLDYKNYPMNINIHMSSGKKKTGIPKLGQLPPIKTTTKLYLTLDCREIYSDKKKSREVALSFNIKDNKLLIKPQTKYIEVGRIDQIRLDEYCQEVNERPENVWSHFADLYKITLDKDIIVDLFENKWCLTVDDLSLVYGYLHFTEHNAFYNLCLADFTELPDEMRENHLAGKDFEFIAVENKNMYPACAYKIELK